MVQDISRKSFLQMGAGLAAAAASAASLSRPADAQTKKATPHAKRSGKTLIKNVDVLTMQEDHAELKGMDVMMSGGKIAAIGKGIPAGDAEVVDGTGKILMPGFVDGFRHNWQSLDTGRILKLNQSYHNYYGGYTGKLGQTMTPEELYLSDYMGCVEALNSGFTYVINFSMGGPLERAEASARGAKDSGVGGAFAYTPAAAGRRVSSQEQFNGAVALPGPDEFAVAQALKDKVFHSGDDMQLACGMNLRWGATYADFKQYFDRARALKPQLLMMHHHSDGSGGGNPGAQFKPAPKPPGTIRTVQDLEDSGVLGPDLHMGHGTELTDDELKMLAKYKITMASGILAEFTYAQNETSIHARARAHGIPAGIGFDTPLEWCRDPFEMSRMAITCLYRTPENWKIADTYGSDDSLVFFTRDGAKCAKRGDVAGTVTVGKMADLVLIDTSRLGFPVIGTLADRVANFGTLADIDSVWVAGKARKRHGKMVGVDMAALKAKVVKSQERVWEAMGKPVYGIRG
jgi:cytosine/adenosine deaminase-related metal-dependent hydrolase